MEYKILKNFFILLLFIPVFAKTQGLPFLITEIMYNPEGNDTDREWLEVYNNSSQTFYLKSGRSGWRINDGENHLFKEDMTIYPQEVFVIVQDRDKFSSEYPEFRGKIVSANFFLKNTSGKIQIFDENKNLLAERYYEENCGGSDNGYSIIFENSTCHENKIKNGTPGIYPEKEITRTNANYNEPMRTENSTRTDAKLNINREPMLTDKELRTNAGNDNHELMQTNKEVHNSSTDSSQEFVAENNIRISSRESSYKFAADQDILPTLYISEFLPNPKGNDYGQEFVELYNYGDEEIDLEGFVLEIGSKRIKLKGMIEPQEYFVITNENYGFNIRNQGEKLALYYKEQKIFSIDYQGKAPEGKSFAQFEKKWQFTEPTPGKENKLALETFRKEEASSQPNFSEDLKFTSLINPKQIDKSNNNGSLLIVLSFLGIIIILSLILVLVL